MSRPNLVKSRLNEENESNAGSDPSLVRESILRSSSSSENRRNSDVAANGSSGRAKTSSASVGNGNSNGHVVTFAADAADAENGTNSTTAASIYAPSPAQPPAAPVATHPSPKSGRRNPLRMLSNAIDFRGKRRGGGGGGGGLRHRTSSAEDAEMRIAAAAIVSQGRERAPLSLSLAFSYFTRHSCSGSFMNIRKMLFCLHVIVVM